MTERERPVPAGEGAGGEDRHPTPDELVDIARLLGDDPTTLLHHLTTCADCSDALDSLAVLRGVGSLEPDSPGRAEELAESVIAELSLGVRRTHAAPGRAARVSGKGLPVLGAAGAAAVAAAATAGLLAGAGDVATGPIPLLLIGVLGGCWPVVEDMVSRSR